MKVKIIQLNKTIIIIIPVDTEFFCELFDSPDSFDSSGPGAPSISSSGSVCLSNSSDSSSFSDSSFSSSVEQSSISKLFFYIFKIIIFPV